MSAEWASRAAGGLKVYLGKVDATTHATGIAMGSHRTTCFSYGAFHEPSFGPTYVDPEIPPAPVFVRVCQCGPQAPC